MSDPRDARSLARRPPDREPLFGRGPGGRPIWRVVVSFLLAVAGLLAFFRVGLGGAAACVLASLAIYGRRPKPTSTILHRGPR